MTLSPALPSTTVEKPDSAATEVTRSVARPHRAKHISFERWLRYLAMVGIAVLIFAVGIEDQLYEPGSPRISRFAGFAAVGLAAPALALHGRRHRFIDAHFLALAFGAVVVASTRWSSAETANTFAFTTLQVIFMMWLVWEFVDTKGKLQTAFLAWAAGGAVNIGALAYQFFVIKEPTDGLYNRYTGGDFADANDVASVVALGVPMVWYLANTLKNPLLRLLLLGYIPPAVFGVAITGSRGGFFVLLTSLLVIPMTVGTLKVAGRVFVVGLMGLGLVLAPQLLPEEQLSRALNEDEAILRGPTTDATSGRGELFEQALIGFSENWQRGVGADNSQFYLMDSTDFIIPLAAHNTPADVALQTGLLGLAPFVLLLVAIGWRTLKGPLFQRRVAMGLFLATIAMMMPAHLEGTKRLWLMFALILCTAVHLNSEVSTRTGRATK